MPKFNIDLMLEDVSKAVLKHLASRSREIAERLTAAYSGDDLQYALKLLDGGTPQAEIVRAYVCLIQFEQK